MTTALLAPPSTDGRSSIAVRVLGAITLTEDGTQRPLSRQSRRLLACLALAGGALSVDRLATVIDPDESPRPATVWMAVSRLRRQLDGRLVSDRTGHRLALTASDQLDIDRLDHAVRDALEAIDDRRLPLLRAALDGCTGVPAAEFADEPWAQPVARRWEEQRHLMVEELAAALLAGGRAVEAIGLLEEELVELRYRERPVELLMRALADTGRVADALRAYARFRRVLVADIGIEPSVRLREVERAVLAAADASTRYGTNRRPVHAPTGLIGRDHEVAAVSSEVRAHRLVTLTGVGGVGKTAIATQVVAASIDGFDDVAVVELAPILDPAGLAAAVADSLGVMVGAGSGVTASIVAALEGRAVLIVFDNCEHLADASADLIEAILAGAPDVHVLATSRQPLGSPGERRWPVEPLDPFAASRLFVDRARAVRPAFGADDAVIAEICHRVDGIPLAIELAAARVLTMPAAEIAARLDERFDLLVGGRRRPERHRTLRAAIGWSVDLLDAVERDALSACAVFAGGFDIRAAAAVMDADEYDALHVLESLTHQSLLVAAPGPASVRFTMLETIRQFVADEMAAEAPLRDRHAAYFTALAAAEAFAEVELDNLRAAYEWALRQGDVDAAASIAADATMCAWRYCRYEPLGWIDEILDLATQRNSAVLARLHVAASQCAWLGQPDRALAHLARAEALLDDPTIEGVGRGQLRARAATAHLFAGRVELAVELDAALAAEPGPWRLAGLCGLLYDLPELGRFDEARAIVDEVVDAARASASPFFLCWALTGAARAQVARDPAAALDSAYDALAISRSDGIRVAELVIARDVAALESAHRDRRVAADMFRMVLHGFHRSGDWVNLAVTFGELAHHFAAASPTVAATMCGAAGIDGPVRQVRGRQAVEARLRSALGDGHFDAVAAGGSAMTRAQAVAYAEEHLAR